MSMWLSTGTGVGEKMAMTLEWGGVNVGDSTLAMSCNSQCWTEGLS